MTRIGIRAEIDLAEIDTDILDAELKKRRGFVAHLHIDSLIESLADYGCPQDIIDALGIFGQEPVPNTLMLRNWCLACGVDPEHWVRQAA